MGSTPSKVILKTPHEIQKAHDDLVDFIVSKYSENPDGYAIWIHKDNPLLVKYMSMCGDESIRPVLDGFNNRCKPTPYVVTAAYQEGVVISFVQNLRNQKVE